MSPRMQKILGIDTNAKTVKGQAYGYLTAVVYLAPANESGRNVCRDASPGCKADCLFTAGRGALPSTVEARIAKTLALFRDKEAWLAQLKKEIAAFVRKAEKAGFVPCVRLNGTSDLPWELFKIEGKCIMDHFPTLQFHDYTKSRTRMEAFLAGKMPANYYLTFSRSETNGKDALAILEAGGNVAFVFHSVPSSYLGFEVLDGDAHDLRFIDKRGAIVGLKAKGKAKKSTNGFVI